MPTTSAVSKTQADAHDDAAEKLDVLSDELIMRAGELSDRAARGSTVWSSVAEASAVHERDGLMRTARELRKLVRLHHEHAEAFRRGPCPACQRAQGRHCAGCGSCPGMQVSNGHLREDCHVLTGELVTAR